MAGDNSVQEQTCQRCKDGIDKQLENDMRRLNGHSEKISDLGVLMTRVVELQEISSKTLEKQTEQLATQNETLVAVKVRVEKLEKARSEKAELAAKFWQSRAGFIVIVGGVVLVLSITMAAIGQNYLADFQALAGSVKP